ncbi:hypothetical protein NQ315_006974 [Exocentrus adspersus]|uniref:THAP4-like heme-binding domain-containing protein n=1 Tax=Exocentrus adspersus TaxID=1586481 RepID=A0AAV8WCZ9_9CUCU|nr:hypothetical protein NQ315_006974 [Exocentrus adspersus]
MNVTKIHEKLKPLSWIIGEWRSVTAIVNYPTMKHPVSYTEKLSFVSHQGRPFLNYQSLTWNDLDNSPMHSESGFLHIDDDATSVALILAQAFGVVTIEEGEVKDNTINTTSSHVGHMRLVKHKVVSITRSYRLNEKGQLEYWSMLGTPRTPLTEHIFALYEK